MHSRKHIADELERLDVLAPPAKPAYAHEDDKRSGAKEEKVLNAARVLWLNKRFLAKVGVRAAVILLLIALLLPATYDSKVQLMPPNPQSAGASMLAALAGGSSLGGKNDGGGSGILGIAEDLLGLNNSGALFISILESDTVENALINRFDLRREYWVKTYKQARKKLASNTDITQDRKSGVITINVTDHGPQRATAIAQAYIDELNRKIATVNTSSAHQERIFLESRLKVVKQQLDGSAKALSDYASAHTTLDLQAQSRTMLDAAATLQGQLIAAESELRGLEQIYTPYNIRVKTVRARIDELQHQIEKLGGAPTTPEPDLDSEALYPSIKQLPLVGLKYSDLYRQTKINETVYEVLRREYELARVEEAKEVPVVKILVPPEFPERRSGPPRLLILLGGTILVLLLAAAWILIREAWANTAEEDPRKAFALSVQGEVSQTFHDRRVRDLSRDFFREAFLWRSINRNGHDPNRSSEKRYRK